MRSLQVWSSVQVPLPDKVNADKLNQRREAIIARGAMVRQRHGRGERSRQQERRA